MELKLLNRLQEHKKWLTGFEGNSNPEATSHGQKLKLLEAVISDIEIESQDFSSAELCGCEFINVNFVKCSFYDVIGWGSKFSNCTFDDCALVKAQLNDVIFENAIFKECDFQKSDLSGASLLSAEFVSCDLSWAWLLGTDFRFSKFDGVTLDNARIDRAKFFNLKMSRTNSMNNLVFKEVDLSMNGDGSLMVDNETFDSWLTQSLHKF
jgi:uncharacterized protein YjbI with pentapeptide repeats